VALTLTDNLSISLISSQVDAEGNELGVDSLFTVFKQQTESPKALRSRTHFSVHGRGSPQASV